MLSVFRYHHFSWLISRLPSIALVIFWYPRDLILVKRLRPHCFLQIKKYIKSADGEIRDLKFFYKNVVQIKPNVTNFCIFQNQIKTTQLQIGLKAIITIYYNFALLFYNLCSNNIIVKPLKLKFLDSVFVKCGFLTSWIESLRTLVAECEWWSLLDVHFASSFWDLREIFNELKIDIMQIEITCLLKTKMYVYIKMYIIYIYIIIKAS